MILTNLRELREKLVLNKNCLVDTMILLPSLLNSLFTIFVLINQSAIP